MRTTWIALLFVGSLWSGDAARLRFDQLKAEARSAVAGKDWSIAEARYREALQVASDLRIPVTEVHSDVVSPLADAYRRMDATERLEQFLQQRVDAAGSGLEKGLAQADLGFFYQAGDFSSADQFHGERLIDEAVRSFEQCASVRPEAAECRRRFAYTAGVQGAMFYQRRDYDRAEPLFRKVIGSPEASTPEEIMLVSLHALGGILVNRRQFQEAEKIQAKAAAFESSHPNALRRLKQEGSRSRKR